MICNKLKDCTKEQFAGRAVLKCANSNVKCVESSDMRSKVKCEERKKKYILENTMKNHVVSYRMDGGIIRLDKSVPEDICKCDYLILVHGKEDVAILVELKGVNVAHALKQIQGTLMLFKDYFTEFSHVYGRVVVTSAAPNLKATPDYVNLIKMLRKTFKGNLKIVEKQFQERDIDFGHCGV